MLATSSLSCSSSCSASSFLNRDWVSGPLHSRLSMKAAGRPCRVPRFSASFTSAGTERERCSAGGGRYSHSRSCCSSGGDVAVGTLYEVLGLKAGATAREIKAAYRRLARACHPDAAVGGRQGASADEFMRVHAAYATLSDPDKRAEYDRRITTSASPSGSWFSSSASIHSSRSCSSSSSFGVARRTWETDQCW